MTIPIEKTYTVHLPLDRSNDEPPIMTIVLAKADNGYKIGISVCSAKDQFNKKLGRKIAYGRMLNSAIFDKDLAANEVAFALINRKDLFGVREIYDDILTVFLTLEDRMKNK